jgi:PilZ domain
MLEERRTKQRFPIQLPVVITGARTGTKIRGVTRDVSANGVFFYTKKWALGFSAIAFRMIFSKSTRVLCEGTVVRLEELPGGRTGVAATIASHDFG